ncbi:hypothetical protein ACFW1P_33290 [Paenibacillus sp. NPDC058910]|uniref:hypothetical protein n=1 Tax=Paenibacillus sp. NPDC058910 TaxID=3346670 RepID=UPI00368C9253
MIVPQREAEVTGKKLDRPSTEGRQARKKTAPPVVQQLPFVMVHSISYSAVTIVT